MDKLLTIFSFLCLLTAGLVSCDLSTDDEFPVIEPTPEPIYYFRAAVAGEDFALDIREVSQFEPGVTYFNDSIRIEGACRYDYGARIKEASNPITASLELQNWYNGDCGEEAEGAVFNTLFFSESAPYYDADNPSSEKSVILRIEYPDGIYSTAFGNNNNADFRLTGTAANNTADGRYQLITASFDCTVYKEDDPSDKKTVTNGGLQATISAVHN